MCARLLWRLVWLFWHATAKMIDAQRASASAQGYAMQSEPYYADFSIELPIRMDTMQ